MLVLKRWSIIYNCPFTITARTLLDFDVRDFKLFWDAFFALSVVPAALVVPITRKPVLFSAVCRGDIVLDRVRRVNDGVAFALASSSGWSVALSVGQSIRLAAGCSFPPGFISGVFLHTHSNRHSVLRLIIDDAWQGVLVRLDFGNVIDIIPWPCEFNKYCPIVGFGRVSS